MQWSTSDQSVFVVNEAGVQRLKLFLITVWNPRKSIRVRLRWLEKMFEIRDSSRERDLLLECHVASFIETLKGLMPWAGFLRMLGIVSSRLTVQFEQAFGGVDGLSKRQMFGPRLPALNLGSFGSSGLKGITPSPTIFVGVACKPWFNFATASQRSKNCDTLHLATLSGATPKL